MGATLTEDGWLVDEIDRQLVQYDAETQSLVDGAGNNRPLPVVPEKYDQYNLSTKLQVVGGRVYRGQRPCRAIGINAWDLFYDYLKAGTAYTTDLTTIAGYGIKTIRVSATPNTSADLTTYIGSNGGAPTGTYQAKLTAFLNEAARNGVGVILTVIWNVDQLVTALSGTKADLATSTSTTRVWLRDFSRWLAKNFYDHPGLAGWNIANEWVNYAWGDRFTTVSADTTKDHIGAMIDCTNDICREIRKYDAGRFILSAGGSLGNGSMGPFNSLADRYVASAGECDAVSYHWYLDSWTNSSSSHAFVGDDLGGSDFLLPALRNACAAKGKALVIDEMGADYDSPANTVAQVHYNKVRDLGIDLALDWSWYASSGAAPDLKTTRLACMAEIQARNALLESATLPALQPVYPATIAKPATAFRGVASANSWVRVPVNSGYQPSAGTPFAIMFWMREPTLAMVASRRIIACNDANGGFLVTANDFESSGIADYVQFEIMFGGILRGLTARQNKRRPGEWHHYAFAWDGVNSTSGVVASWFDGVPARGNALSGGGTPAASANLLYIGSAADGLSNNAVDVADVIIVKGGSVILKSQQVSDYLRTGAVPAGAVMRLKLDGSANDSVGLYHGTLGAAGSYVATGL